MKKQNTFTNFDQFLDTLNPTIGDNVRKIEEKTRVARRLQLIRMSKGLSQNEIATRMGCTQGNVSKIENKFDDDLTFGDVKLYLQAVHSGMGFTIGPDLTLAESINKNIKELDKGLKKLKHIKSGEDQDLSNAIDEYLSTSHKKLLNIILKSMSGMQDNSNKGQTNIHFDAADIDEGECYNTEEHLTALGAGSL